MLAAAVAGAELLSFGIGARGPDPGFARPFDSWPLGGAIHFLAAPLVRWDAHYYLRVAQHGYSPHVEALRGARAFFPAYPLLVRVLGGFAGSGAAAIAAIAISLAALAAGLRLLHRLAALELGDRAADATVLLLAFAPVAFFFGAPYTESLFLLLSVAAFLAARRERWALAGAAAGLASATRPTGAILVVPLAILYLQRPRGVTAGRAGRAIRPDVLWLALAPAGVVAYSLYLRHAVGDALAWQHVQPLFGRRSFEWPTETLRQAAVAAFHAVKGDGPDAYRGPILLETAYLPLVVAGIVGAFRRLPLAYGAYALGAFALAIASPAYVEPLRSLPRLMLPVFPIAMWLGAWTEERRLTRPLALASAAALALLTAAFASWQPYV